MSTILLALVVTFELLVASKVWRFPTDIRGNCGTRPRIFGRILNYFRNLITS